MAHLKRRVIVPDLFARPDLQPSSKRVLFAGMLCLAEDSGCLLWDAGFLKALILPFEGSAQEVAGWMDECVRDGLAWPYRLEGRTFAYLPDFHRWQGRMIRWNAPESVPLPAGITFTPSTAKERAGSGFYEWPTSKEALEAGEPSEPSEPSKASELKQVNESREVKGTKEPAPQTAPQVAPLPADTAQRIPLLIQRLGKERTKRADQAARAHAHEHGVEATDEIRRFYLEAELEQDVTGAR